MARRDQHKVDLLARRSKALSLMMGEGVDNNIHKEIIVGLLVTMSKKMGMLPKEWSDDKCLLTLHKYRYEMKWVDAEKRHESRYWLEKRGYHRLKMEPWPEEGVLP